ncbi:hypothetical protein Cch01nite_17330 [Cellulomonas chitinilytica]|uniref:DUF998 domain-containing protein n=1 Tax=Cellulomonas chitinilytica TaxID=398759 RepID=A0A919U2D1_9CELL|nr:hypothetical protein [Cellulomonas chitinilytica]GIG21009.1 hypothetical protein Cch01nite_17330 [Cellulomonas chitinilytica]
MTDGPQPAPPDAVADALTSATRTTYRSLRVAIVAMALLLATSLVIEIGWGDGARFGSVSGYFYSPVRNVLVGSLVAIGPALIAIKGRPGWEDSLLDLAGMVIPFVAFVPVPVAPGPDGCPGPDRCIPPDLVPGVDNNVTALLLVGTLVLAFAWWNRADVPTGSRRVGLVVLTGVWVAFAVWFVGWHDAFLVGAHYAAAILFFVCIAGAAAYAARQVNQPPLGKPKGMSPDAYSTAYGWLSLLMLATVVGAAIAALVGWWRGAEQWPYSLLTVEAVLLGLFVVFWILQTTENWDEEAVETAARSCPPPSGNDANAGQP